MNSLDYIWRVFGHQAAGNHGLPAPGGVINGICVADQVWTMKVNTSGRVWHQVEPPSVQAWYQWNRNEADGNGNGDYLELKAVFERQNVVWIPRATSGDISWVLFPRHQICSQILLNTSLLAVSASNLSPICSQDQGEADEFVVSRETVSRKWWVQAPLKDLLSRLCGAGFLPVFMETGTGICVAKCWVLGWGY